MAHYSQSRPARRRRAAPAPADATVPVPVPVAGVGDEYPPAMMGHAMAQQMNFADPNLGSRIHSYFNNPIYFDIVPGAIDALTSCQPSSNEYLAPGYDVNLTFAPYCPNAVTHPAHASAHGHALSGSSYIVHPNPNNHKAPSSFPSDQYHYPCDYNLNDMIDASAIISFAGSSSSNSSSTDGTPPTGSDSSPEMVRYDSSQDFRIARLTAEQVPIYQDLLRHPHQYSAAIESLLSIAARGNMKPLRTEISSFLQIDHLPETKSGKGSRVGLKKYRCSLCSELNTDRWDTAEYHIHGHLGLKVFPCGVHGCGYSFRRPHELKNHEETIHKIFKPSAPHGGRRVPADSTETTTTAYGPYSKPKASFAVASQTASAAPAYSTGSFALGHPHHEGYGKVRPRARLWRACHRRRRRGRRRWKHKAMSPFSS